MGSRRRFSALVVEDSFETFLTGGGEGVGSAVVAAAHPPALRESLRHGIAERAGQVGGSLSGVEAFEGEALSLGGHGVRLILSVPLMPARSPGEYQGVFATGEAAAVMAAPVLMTTLIVNWGQPGWIALAIIFLIPAAVMIPATRWAINTRPRPAGQGKAALTV